MQIHELLRNCTNLSCPMRGMSTKEYHRRCSLCIVKAIMADVSPIDQVADIDDALATMATQAHNKGH